MAGGRGREGGREEEGSERGGEWQEGEGGREGERRREGREGERNLPFPFRQELTEKPLKETVSRQHIHIKGV